MHSWMGCMCGRVGGQVRNLSTKKLLAPFAGSRPVGRDVDVVDGAQGGVQHAAADAVIDLFQGRGGGDHGGQLGIVAVVEQLVEFLARPGGGALCAEVIKDEQRGGAHFLKEAVVRDGAAGTEGGAQVVQQIGDDDEHGFVALSMAVVTNGRCQMSLAGAVCAHQDQPAGRFLGETLGGAEGFIHCLLLCGGQFLILTHAEIAKRTFGMQVQ